MRTLRPSLIKRGGDCSGTEYTQILREIKRECRRESSVQNDWKREANRDLLQRADWGEVSGSERVSS